MIRKSELELQLKSALEKNLITEQLRLIAVKRAEHAEIEAAQARVSRDNYREKLNMLLLRIKEQEIQIVVTAQGKDGKHE